MSTTFRFEGDLEGSAAKKALAQIDGVPAGSGPLVLEMTDAEVEDAQACAALSASIREAAIRIGDVVVLGAPQVLAHTLYRLGALSSGAIQLIEPRDEIGHPG